MTCAKIKWILMALEAFYVCSTQVFCSSRPSFARVYAITILESEWCDVPDSHSQVNDFSYVQFMEMKNYAFPTIIINIISVARHTFGGANDYRQSTERHTEEMKGVPAASKHCDRLMLIIDVIKFNRNQFSTERNTPTSVDLPAIGRIRPFIFRFIHDFHKLCATRQRNNVKCH